MVNLTSDSQSPINEDSGIAVMSIMDGVAELEDEWLNLGCHSRLTKGNAKGGYSKTAAIELFNSHPSRNGNNVAHSTFIRILERFEQNYSDSSQPMQSRENWRWKQQLKLRSQNDGEKRLERCWAFLTDQSDWINHVPVASFATYRDGSRAIDLVHDCGQQTLEFIELKYGKKFESQGSNHPLHAAIEILEYGLLYLWSRSKSRLPRGKFKSAKAVELIVLAPPAFYCQQTYRHQGVKWLETEITLGLALVCDQLFPDRRFQMSFRFEQFTKEFQEYYEDLKSATKGFPNAIAGCRTGIRSND
jgi:hypothetical protein